MAESDATRQLLAEANRHSKRLLAELSADRAALDVDRSLPPDDLLTGQQALQKVIESAQRIREILDQAQ